MNTSTLSPIANVCTHTGSSPKVVSVLFAACPSLVAFSSPSCLLLFFSASSLPLLIPYLSPSCPLVPYLSRTCSLPVPFLSPLLSLLFPYLSPTCPLVLALVPALSPTRPPPCQTQLSFFSRNFSVANKALVSAIIVHRTPKFVFPCPPTVFAWILVVGIMAGCLPVATVPCALFV